MKSEIRPAVILPTYNNAATLPEIVARTAALGLPMFVVDDGSTDGTAAWLAAPHDAGTAPLLHVITHQRNRGKAAALRTGFAAALERGFTHAATMDTDGQLDPEEIPRLLEVAEREPDALVLGFRDETRDDYPARSRLGRRLSNGAIRIECGARVEDSQCGLRVYPLAMTCALRCRAERFGYEAEIITRAAWAGCPVRNVPVTCRYFAGDERVTHFAPWRDSARGVALHARLLLASAFRRFAQRPRRGS